MYVHTSNEAGYSDSHPGEESIGVSGFCGEHVSFLVHHINREILEDRLSGGWRYDNHTSLWRLANQWSVLQHWRGGRDGWKVDGERGMDGREMGREGGMEGRWGGREGWKGDGERGGKGGGKCNL